MKASSSPLPRPSRLLTTTVLSTLVGMTAYEAAKTWLLPHQTSWESHFTTIGFTTVLATLVAYLVFRKVSVFTQQRQCAHQIVSHAAEGILTVSKRGQVLSLNPAAEHLFGYTTAELQEEPITKLLTEAPTGDRRNLLHDSLPIGSILGLAAGAREMIGKRKNGDTFPIEMTVSSMTLNGEPVCVTFARDVSKRKQAQRYLTAHYAATCVLAEANSLAEALPRVLQSICEALRWDAGAYWHVDAEGGLLRGAEVYQAPFAALPKLPDARTLTGKPGEGLPGRVWSTGQADWVEDFLLSKDEPLLSVDGLLPLRGSFAFPVRVGEDVCGVLSFYSSGMQKRDDQLLHILGVLGDQLGEFIARERHEQELLRSEERFRQLAENIHEVFWMVDAHDDQMLYLSPSCEEVLGRPSVQFERHSRSFVDFIHADDRDRVLSSWGQQKLGRDTSEEYRVVWPDGSVHWVWDRAFPIVNDAGAVYRIAGLTADITERRQMETALNKTSQTLQSLVEAAPVAIHLIDLEGNVVLWNPAAERMLGWTAAEVLNQRLPMLVDAGHNGSAGERSSAAPDQTCHGIATHYRRKDGTLLDVSLSSAPLRNPAGEVFGRMVILMDLTEQKRLEEHLRQAQKMEAVGQLAGGVAHDFNNLLTIITGYSEVLLGSVEEGGLSRDYLEQIHKAGAQAAALTSQLLAFGRKQTLQVRVLDLNTIVQNTGKMLRRLIGEDVEMIVRPDLLLGCVTADPGQIEQILMNLATNARDAMPDGGTLTIATANVELGTTPSSLPQDVKPGPYVMFAVSDTGCGIDPATKARIFEPFFTTKGIGKGTGLGLSTVYGIVKQSHGHIEVDSELGRGTRFRVYLPRLAAQEQANRYGPAVATEMPRGQETLLLVEDEDSVRKVVNLALRSSGYTVIEARSGAEALKLFEMHKDAISLLVTDVIMPKMNGRQLVERVSAIQENLKVLYMSGYTDQILDKQGILSPGTAFLQKPISLGALTKKVREVLDAPVAMRP